MNPSPSLPFPSPTPLSLCLFLFLFENIFSNSSISKFRLFQQHPRLKFLGKSHAVSLLILLKKSHVFCSSEKNKTWKPSTHVFRFRKVIISLSFNDCNLKRLFPNEIRYKHNVKMYIHNWYQQSLEFVQRQRIQRTFFSLDRVSS